MKEFPQLRYSSQHGQLSYTRIGIIADKLLTRMIDWIRQKVVLVGLLFLLISSLGLNFWQFQKNQQLRQVGGIKVIGVIDGDTLVLEGKVRLRLRQVDAPELEYCRGKEAKEFLEKLVKNKVIFIKEKILDQKGRAMALVYLADGTLVNQEILARGLGRYHHDKTSVSSKLKTAFEQAKADQRGIFSPDCYQTEPSRPDCVIKGNIDRNNKKIKRYYLPSCAQYQFVIVEKDLGEQWFCSEQEAQKAGYRKAKTCR